MRDERGQSSENRKKWGIYGTEFRRYKEMREERGQSSEATKKWGRKGDRVQMTWRWKVRKTTILLINKQTKSNVSGKIRCINITYNSLMKYVRRKEERNWTNFIRYLVRKIKEGREEKGGRKLKGFHKIFRKEEKGRTRGERRKETERMS